MTAQEVAARCSCKPCRHQVALAAERYAKVKAQPLVAVIKQFLMALEAETDGEMTGLLQKAEADAEAALEAMR